MFPRSSRWLIQHQPPSPGGVEWSDTLRTSDDEFDVKEVDDRPKRAIPRRPVFGHSETLDFDDSVSPPKTVFV